MDLSSAFEHLGAQCPMHLNSQKFSSRHLCSPFDTYLLHRADTGRKFEHFETYNDRLKTRVNLRPQDNRRDHSLERVTQQVVPAQADLEQDLEVSQQILAVIYDSGKITGIFPFFF